MPNSSFRAREANEFYSVIIGHPTKEVFTVVEHNLRLTDAHAIAGWYLRRGRPACVQPQSFSHPATWKAGECPHCRKEAESALERARRACS